MSKYTAFIHTDNEIGKLSISVMEFDSGGREINIHIYRPDGSDVWSGSFWELIDKLEMKE